MKFAISLLLTFTFASAFTECNGTETPELGMQYFKRGDELIMQIREIRRKEVETSDLEQRVQLAYERIKIEEALKENATQMREIERCLYEVR